MNEDGSTDGLGKTRPVLGDLTNRQVKRSFSAYTGQKPVDGCGKNSKNDSQFAKQLRSAVDKFIREKGSSGLGIIDNTEMSLSGSKDNKQPCRSSSTSTETNGSREIMGSLVSIVPQESPGAPAPAWTDLWSEACRRRDDEQRRASDAARTDLVVGPVVTVRKESEEGLGLLKKPGSVEWSKLPNQGSQPQELDRCVTLKDGCANLSVGDNDGDILKACSCSFCLKAAYIWSDLQYQDIKGRIAALKKSQKEASALAQNSGKGIETDVPSQGNPAKSSKLESDLTGQWKSLFRHMEDVFHNENNQHLSSFLMLKDLRENCKTDLENINAMPSQKH